MWFLTGFVQEESLSPYSDDFTQWTQISLTPHIFDFDTTGTHIQVGTVFVFLGPKDTFFLYMSQTKPHHQPPPPPPPPPPLAESTHTCRSLSTTGREVLPMLQESVGRATTTMRSLHGLNDLTSASSGTS